MRNEVMDWTMGNCGRLQYTPEVVLTNLTPQQAVLIYLSRAKVRSRQLAGAAVSYVRARLVEQAFSYVKEKQLVKNTVNYVKQKKSWVWDRFFKSTATQDSFTRIKNAPVTERYQDGSVFIDARSDTKMPFGFALKCEQSQPCRLFYSAPKEQTQKATITKEDCEKIARNMLDLENFSSNLDKAKQITMQLMPVLMFMELILMMAALMSRVSCQNIDPTQMKLSKDEKYPAKLLVIQFLSLLPAIIPCFKPRHTGEFAIIVGILITVVGCVRLVRFFISANKVENIVKACGAIGDLWLIMRRRDIPAHKKNDAPATSANQSLEKAHVTDAKDDQDILEDEPTTFIDYRRSSKPPHRLADQTTTVEEDLEAERKMIEEQVKRLEAAMATDSESESDTDIESNPEDRGFVDLATGVTPSITETESEWALVDA
jgi:hypothetical protein